MMIYVTNQQRSLNFRWRGDYFSLRSNKGNKEKEKQIIIVCLTIVFFFFLRSLQVSFYNRTEILSQLYYWPKN